MPTAWHHAHRWRRLHPSRHNGKKKTGNLMLVNAIANRLPGRWQSCRPAEDVKILFCGIPCAATAETHSFLRRFGRGMGGRGIGRSNSSSHSSATYSPASDSLASPTCCQTQPPTSFLRIKGLPNRIFAPTEQKMDGRMTRKNQVKSAIPIERRRVIGYTRVMTLIGSLPIVRKREVLPGGSGRPGCWDRSRKPGARPRPRHAPLASRGHD